MPVLKSVRDVYATFLFDKGTVWSSGCVCGLGRFAVKGESRNGKFVQRNPVAVDCSDAVVSVFIWKDMFQGVLKPSGILCKPWTVSKRNREIEIQNLAAPHDVFEFQFAFDSGTLLYCLGQSVADRFEIFYDFALLGI